MCPEKRAEVSWKQVEKKKKKKHWSEESKMLKEEGGKCNAAKDDVQVPTAHAKRNHFFPLSPSSSFFLPFSFCENVACELQRDEKKKHNNNNNNNTRALDRGEERRGFGYAKLRRFHFKMQHHLCALISASPSSSSLHTDQPGMTKTRRRWERSCFVSDAEEKNSALACLLTHDFPVLNRPCPRFSHSSCSPNSKNLHSMRQRDVEVEHHRRDDRDVDVIDRDKSKSSGVSGGGGGNEPGVQKRDPGAWKDVAVEKLQLPKGGPERRRVVRGIEIWVGVFAVIAAITLPLNIVFPRSTLAKLVTRFLCGTYFLVAGLVHFAPNRSVMRANTKRIYGNGNH